MALVFAPIPILSYFFPFIGHLGITRSDGTILDFAGPYMVNVDSMLFGPPTKYVSLDPRLMGHPGPGCASGGKCCAAPPALPPLPPDGGAGAWDGALKSSKVVYEQVGP